MHGLGIIGEDRPRAMRPEHRFSNSYDSPGAPLSSDGIQVNVTDPSMFAGSVASTAASLARTYGAAAVAISSTECAQRHRGTTHRSSWP